MWKQKAQTSDNGAAAECPSLGIVIPALDAGEDFPKILQSLQEATCLFDLDIVVVDGGSGDETVHHAQKARARVLETAPDPAAQIQAGLDIVFGDWLMILDAGTMLRPGWSTVVRAFVEQKGAERFAGYGKLAVREDGKIRREDGALSKLRNQFSGLPFLHQGFILHRGLLNRMGGVMALGGLDRMTIAGRVGHKHLIPLPFQAIQESERLPRVSWGARLSRVAGWLIFALLMVPPSAVADWTK
ncbi:glycosyltransferase [Aestuariispira insulae]|nr:glycosyltransferase [Aestuariispira insulae]